MGDEVAQEEDGVEDAADDVAHGSRIGKGFKGELGRDFLHGLCGLRVSVSIQMVIIWLVGWLVWNGLVSRWMLTDWDDGGSSLSRRLRFLVEGSPAVRRLLVLLPLSGF